MTFIIHAKQIIYLFYALLKLNEESKNQSDIVEFWFNKYLARLCTSLLSSHTSCWLFCLYVELLWMVLEMASHIILNLTSPSLQIPLYGSMLLHRWAGKINTYCFTSFYGSRSSFLMDWALVLLLPLVHTTSTTTMSTKMLSLSAVSTPAPLYLLEPLSFPSLASWLKNKVSM